MYFERNEKNIRKDIERSITHSMLKTFDECNSNIPQEPDFIASLVENIPYDLYNSLYAYVPGYKFAVSGIFCHQKPLADFGKEKSPEIGDILFVYIEENKDSENKCNALLMQAKKCETTPYSVNKSEEHQLKLYEEWPPFRLSRAGKFTGEEINIQPKTLNPGAQYLLLQSPYKDGKKVCCAYPDKELVPEKRLSNQIIDLMKFFTGRTFRIEDCNNDDWSKLIMYLLWSSATSLYNRRNIKRVNQCRQNMYGDFSLFMKYVNMIDMIDNVYYKASLSSLIIIAKEVGKEFNQQD